MSFWKETELLTMPATKDSSMLKPVFGKKSRTLYFSYRFINIFAVIRGAEVCFFAFWVTSTDLTATNRCIKIASPICSPIQQTAALVLQEKRKREDEEKNSELLLWE